MNVSFHRFSRCLLLVLVVGLVAACSRLTSENVAKIHTGMTQAEVKAILGSPSDTETGGAFGLSTTTFIYTSGSNRVKISFLNDGVVATEGSFH